MAKGTKLASGYIELGIEYSDALKKITKDLNDLEKASKKVGDETGKNLAKGAEDTAKNIESSKKSAKDLGDELTKTHKKIGDSTKAVTEFDTTLTKSKKTASEVGDELDKGVQKGARNAGKTVEKEISGAGKKASEGIAESIINGALKASQDSGKALSDALVNAAGEGGKALGNMVGDSRVGHWLQDVSKSVQDFRESYITPAVEGVQSLADGFRALQDNDVTGALDGVAGALDKIGQTDASNKVKDLAKQAAPLQDSFSQMKGSIEGATDGLLTLTGNSGKIAGGLSAISAAAGPLAATFALLQVMPGFTAGASGVIDQLQGKKGFNAKDWFNTFVPGTGVIDKTLGPVTNGADPTKGFQSPIKGKPGVSSIPLPGSAPAVEPGYTAVPGSGNPFDALAPQSGGSVKAAPSGNNGGALSVPLVQTASGAWTSTNPAWAHLIGRESSGINQRQKIIDVNSGGNEAEGFFQITPATWASHGGTSLAPSPLSATPQQQAQIAARILQSNPSGSDWGAGLPGRESAKALLQGLMPTGFDDGGELPPGLTLAHNDTGKPEIILTPEQAKNAMQGMPGVGAGKSDTPPSSGKSPGPNGAAALDELLGGAGPDSPVTPSNPAAPGGKDIRTQGYIPAGAGGSGTAGSSFISGSLQMGAQAINGLIDQAASAASTAISAAATAGSFGAGGQAAGSASSFLIGLGTQAAKRGVEYGFQMAGIGADSLTEILMPFGVPRFFQTDPSQFVPQLPGKAAAVTTGEKAQQKDNPGLPSDPANQPGGPVQPGQLPGAQSVGSPAPIAKPGTGDFKPTPLKIPGLGGTPQSPTPPTAPPDENAGPMPKAPAPAIAAPTPQPSAPTQQQPPKPPTPLDFVPLDMPGVYDDGGWLMPGETAINKSNAPEPMAVFTPEQWGALGAVAKGATMRPDPTQGASYDYRTVIENVTVKDVNELMNEADSRARLQRMRYGGRP